MQEDLHFAKTTCVDDQKNNVFKDMMTRHCRIDHRLISYQNKLEDLLFQGYLSNALYECTQLFIYARWTIGQPFNASGMNHALLRSFGQSVCQVV